MLDYECCVGIEFEPPLVALGFAHGLGFTSVGEALVHILHEGNLVVKTLEVYAAVDTERRLIGDGIAHRHAVDGGAAIPAVGGVVARRRRDEIEHWNTVERGAVGGHETLVVVPWCTER